MPHDFRNVSPLGVVIILKDLLATTPGIKHSYTALQKSRLSLMRDLFEMIPGIEPFIRHYPDYSTSINTDKFWVKLCPHTVQDEALTWFKVKQDAHNYLVQHDLIKDTAMSNNVPEANSAIVPTKGERSGGSVQYYQVEITHPTTKGRKPYTAECNDIIEALEMTPAQANIFKEVWRCAAAKALGKIKVGHDEVYGAEKILFFAQRNMVMTTKHKDSGY